MFDVRVFLDADSVLFEVSSYLMARLYPIARHRYLHAVFDRIGLWMGDKANDDLAESLTRLANEGVRPQLQKTYRAWAASACGSDGGTRAPETRGAGAVTLAAYAKSRN